MTTRNHLKILAFMLLTTLALPAFGYRVERDHAYDSVNGMSLKMDVYTPSQTNDELQPALLYIHGGCFNSGSKSEIDDEVKKLADEGFVVFSLDYRLSYVAKYPAAVTDVQQAVRYIRRNYQRFRVDPSRIAAFGGSAGGYLASVLGLRPIVNRDGINDEYAAPVQVVLDWYGRSDFTRQQSTGTDCATSFLGLPRTAENLPKFEEASLLPHVDDNSATFVIVQGTEDPQVEPIHSVLLANALWDKGRAADLILSEGSGHGFDDPMPWKLTRKYLFNLLRVGDRVRYALTSPSTRIAVDTGSDVGSIWAHYGADQFYEGGFPFRYAISTPTRNTSFPEQYMNVRAGNAFSYKLPLGPGVYRLGLHFAEKNPDINATGQRVMDISLKLPSRYNVRADVRTPILPGLDIFKVTGKDVVMRRYVHVISRTGKIVIDFYGRPGANAILSAMEVDPVPY